MPDWWGVFDLNYEDAPRIWGRDADSVRSNAERWGADYVVVYQDAGTDLGPEWKGAGFETVSQFSWADYENEMGGARPYSGATPAWWLLRLKGALGGAPKG